MKFSELTVLLPCHSLEDFPVYHEGTQADELLAAWCVLWHPALVASAGAAPTWQRIDVPSEILCGRLMSVPPFCLDRLPAGFVARAKNEGGLVVHESSRDTAVEAALSVLDGGDAGVDAELARDFLALGFCRLQVELLTRQMRYSTNIDETHFQNELVAGAQAAVSGDDESARAHLQQCFDTLYEARKQYYPVDVYLLDVTLVAAALQGESLRGQLAGGTPTNLLATTALLRQISQDAMTWPLLLAAIDAGNLAVLGGEREERELPLLSLETVLAELVAGVKEYEELIGRRPQVYGRRRAGLGPALPQLLSKLGYQGALHFTLDDGRFPLGPQSKTRWEGLDSSVIDVLARVPADAAKSETYLGLSRKLADSMDSDHVATMVFAHWPGATSVWHEDLRRVARLSPVLGKFALLDDYFSHTDMPGRLSKFEADEYRTPYLKQAIIRRQPDPISTLVRARRSQAERAAVQAIATLHDLVVGKTASAAEYCETAEQREACDASQTDGTGESKVSAAVAQFAAVLPQASGAAASRLVLVNPLSFARKIGVTRAQAEGSDQSTGDRSVAADVPALGFAWVEPPSAAPQKSRAKPIARENFLRNEFFEVAISRRGGGIQSLFSFAQRGNQLSQQLALRTNAAASDDAWPGANADPDYTTMQAESVEVTVASPALGEIVSRGSLIDAGGRRVAGFRQTTRAWAGSRILRVDVELDTTAELRADPWNSYYAARFAWPDDTAEMWRGVGLTRQRTDAKRIEAPEYIEIDNGSGRISILTGGLPYHRRSQDRMLDSLLVVRGESERKFTFGIGVDVPSVAAAAVEIITPETALLDSGPPPASTSGWFFHLGAKNVVATHWQPLADEPSSADVDERTRRVRGFRARLLETAGQAGRVALGAFRGIASARQVDFLGQTLLELPVEGDRIMLDFAAFEWIEVEAVWS